MPKTHFGFQTVDEKEKSKKVAQVFGQVANRYDLMNDLMSAGIHRLWKHFAITVADIQPSHNILDIASGTGDLVLKLAQRRISGVQIWSTDVNLSMLKIGKDRLLDQGFILPIAAADAEELPFNSDYFDRVFIAFGLRNMTRKEQSLKEAYRVLKPGGRLILLEFSKVWRPLSFFYQFYTFKIVPFLGQCVAKDKESYQYLAESIQMHPDQNTIKRMMTAVGFCQVDYFNLSAGVVAVHRGFKLPPKAAD